MTVIYHRLYLVHYRVGENTVVADANSDDIISLEEPVIILITVIIPVDKVLKAIIMEIMTVNSRVSCKSRHQYSGT